MKLYELDCSEFFSMLRDELGLNILISYKDACKLYDISENHLHYQIRSGRVQSVHKRGKGYVLKQDMDRLLQCNLLTHKHNESNTAKH